MSRHLYRFTFGNPHFIGVFFIEAENVVDAARRCRELGADPNWSCVSRRLPPETVVDGQFRDRLLTETGGAQ
jgi:hypothetical protein